MSEQPLQVDGIPVDEAIRIHLIECDQCREATERARPVKIGQHSRHCAGYWHLQLMRANHEGKINNVVAYTELGDEAPKRGRLE